MSVYAIVANIYSSKMSADTKENVMNTTYVDAY